MDKYLQDQDIALISETAPKLLDFSKIIRADGLIISGSEVLEWSKIFNGAGNGDGGLFLVKFNATTFRIYTATNFCKKPLSRDGKNIQYIDINEDRLKKGENLLYHGTLVVQQDTYKTQHKMWKEYWTWKRNRNKQRSVLEEAYSYDTKHASHLIRLLSMAREILRDGKVLVKRPDAQTLLDIRNGKYTYDEIIKWAEGIDSELKSFEKKSDLPYSADTEAINRLFMEVVQDYWDTKKLS